MKKRQTLKTVKISKQIINRIFKLCFVSEHNKIVAHMFFCMYVTGHQHVGKYCLSNVAALVSVESQHRCCQVGINDAEPTSQVSAERCAWTCLKRCEAKHHQFVFRQHIPRGRLPSCLSLYVQQCRSVMLTFMVIHVIVMCCGSWSAIFILHVVSHTSQHKC